MNPVGSVKEALALAKEEFGPGFSVTVMPHGGDTFPVLG